MAGPEDYDNDKCILIVRKIQAGSATPEDNLFLWQQTCHYIRRGIEQRAYRSRQDPSMSKEDLEQDLYMRIPGWAKTFRTDMTSWGQWARSCWWRWATNHSQYHGRHRPYAWTSVDAVTYIESIKEKGKDTLKQDTYDDIIDMLNNRWKFDNEHFKCSMYQYIYNRIVCGMSKREAYRNSSQKYSLETYRQWEITVIDFYKIYLLSV